MTTPCKISVNATRLFQLPELFAPKESLEEEEDALFDEPARDEGSFEDDFSEDADAFYLPTEREKECLSRLPVSDRWEDAPEREQEIPELKTSFTSYGVFSHEKDGSFRVTYDDSELTGLAGCRTTFCLSPSGLLILLRRGPGGTCMVFEEAHRHLCDYGAPLGVESVVLHTHRLHGSLSEKGGKICVDYTVEIHGARSEKNRLELKIEPQ